MPCMQGEPDLKPPLRGLGVYERRPRCPSGVRRLDLFVFVLALGPEDPERLLLADFPSEYEVGELDQRRPRIARRTRALAFLHVRGLGHGPSPSWVDSRWARRNAASLRRSGWCGPTSSS